MAKQTQKVCADVMACCVDCGRENTGNDAFAWARKHAVETGHSPTVTVTYDIHALNPPTQTRGNDE